ncbi:MAG: hypothetical protein QOF71_2848 [Candidatus Eremiobacteraeota bacterium]|jgi:steroid delta-isomerase-like uncharacterized protein|nr:hypothetical protein [Candidatus Eremiobacteraeota bacterium]
MLPEPSRNEQTVRRIYDAFNARDIPLLASLFADDCVTTDMGTRRTYQGFAGFMDWVKPFADAMPDSTATPGLIVESGDWIATEHVGRGTQTGPFVTPEGELPASNRTVEILFAEFFRLRDGKVVEFRAYWDSGSVLRQMR